MEPGLKKLGGTMDIASAPVFWACAASSCESRIDSAPTWTMRRSRPLPARTHSSMTALRSATVHESPSPVVPLTYAPRTPLFTR